MIDELKQHQNWIAWQMQKDGDRLIKFPIDVKTGGLAAKMPADLHGGFFGRGGFAESGADCGEPSTTSR